MEHKIRGHRRHIRETQNTLATSFILAAVVAAFSFAGSTSPLRAEVGGSFWGGLQNAWSEITNSVSGTTVPAPQPPSKISDFDEIVRRWHQVNPCSEVANPAAQNTRTNIDGTQFVNFINPEQGGGAELLDEQFRQQIEAILERQNLRLVTTGGGADDWGDGGVAESVESIQITLHGRPIASASIFSGPQRRFVVQVNDTSQVTYNSPRELEADILSLLERLGVIERPSNEMYLLQVSAVFERHGLTLESVGGAFRPNGDEHWRNLSIKTSNNSYIGGASVYWDERYIRVQLRDGTYINYTLTELELGIEQLVSRLRTTQARSSARRSSARNSSAANVQP